MRQRYNNYRVLTSDDDWYPFQKKAPRLKFYPAITTGLAFLSILYLMIPLYTRVDTWSPIVRDRRLLEQRKRIFEMLVLTKTDKPVMEEWNRESLF